MTKMTREQIEERQPIFEGLVELYERATKHRVEYFYNAFVVYVGDSYDEAKRFTGGRRPDGLYPDRVARLYDGNGKVGAGMYRDNEDPRKLQALLDEAKLRAITCGNPYELLDIYEEIWTLQDRLNAAYQDEECDLYDDEF